MAILTPSGNERDVPVARIGAHLVRYGDVAVVVDGKRLLAEEQTRLTQELTARAIDRALGRAGIVVTDAEITAATPEAMRAPDAAASFERSVRAYVEAIRRVRAGEDAHRVYQELLAGSDSMPERSFIASTAAPPDENTLTMMLAKSTREATAIRYRRYGESMAKWGKVKELFHAACPNKPSNDRAIAEWLFESADVEILSPEYKLFVEGRNE